MTERHDPNYIAVWVWLAALMLLSVLSAYLPTSAVVIIGIVFGLSFIKALLVVFYYMHVKFEKRLLWVIIPPIILAVVLVCALLPDSANSRKTASKDIFTEHH